VYLNATDPKLATRTWQHVMENIITKKADETLKRWNTLQFLQGHRIKP
jgi:hypothetical protein